MGSSISAREVQAQTSEAGGELSAPAASSATSSSATSSSATSSSATSSSAISSSAPAASSSSSGSGWDFELGARLSVPLGPSLEAQLTTPFALFGRFGVGYVPSSFVGVVTGVLGDTGAIPDDYDPIVNELTDSGFWNVRWMVGLSLGGGFEIGGGYTLIGGGSDIDPNTFAEAFVPGAPNLGLAAVPISVRLHAVSAQIGWRIALGDHLGLRLAVGWTHTVSADVNVELENDELAAQVERETEDAIESYGFTPELSVGLSYRF
ncbi:MAG: hypothetical protein AAGF12_03995 [Myxococcota bacterium]